MRGSGSPYPTRRRVIRDADGQPLQRSEPLIRHEDWEQANKRLDENTSKRNGNRKGGSPLLRVAFCTCGEPAYLGPGRNWPCYRCASRTTHKPCPTGSKGIAAHTPPDSTQSGRRGGRTGGRPSAVNEDVLTVARARKAKGERQCHRQALGVSRPMLYRHLGDKS